MNKILLLLFFFSLHTYSQFQLMNNEKDKKTFRLLSRPSPQNKLSKLLKTHITPQELAKIDYYGKTPNLDNSIRAQFEVNKKGKPWNFRVFLGKENRELSKKVQQLLKDFLINEIPNLKDLYQARNYIQLFSKNGNVTMINASSVIVSDYPPIFKNCSNKRFINSYGCFKEDIENFIINNINYDLLKQEKIIGELRSHVNFKIDKKGKLTNLKVHSYSPNIIKNGKVFDLKIHSYSKQIEEEISRVVDLYKSQIVGAATRNGIPIDSYAGKVVKLYIDENLNLDEISELKNNKYTKFFKYDLSPEEINSTKFDNAIPIIKIFFSYGINGKLHKIWTNAHNKNLSNKIIKVFKKNFKDSPDVKKSYDRTYALSVLRNINGIKQILCDNEFEWISTGILDKCDNCKNFKDLQRNNIIKIEKYIVNKFNSLNSSYSLERKIGYTLKDEGPYNIYNNTNNDFSLIKLMTPNDKIRYYTDDLTLKLGVNEDGSIFKQFGPSVRDFYVNEKDKETISDKIFIVIREQIESIIQKIPKFINPPFKNGKATSIELGNLSFYLNRR